MGWRAPHDYPEDPRRSEGQKTGLGRSMGLPAGRAYSDLVPLVSSRVVRFVTKPPRCGVVQYPARTWLDSVI